MEALDSMASRYGVLPSQLVGSGDPVQDFCLNLWAHNWGVGRERKESILARIFERRGRGQHGRP